MTLGATAVVTGASRGIGRAVAIALAARGFDVALWARDRAGLDGVAREIAAAGGRSVATVCDVTHTDSVTTAADLVRRSMPTVRVVVNNAGAVVRAHTVDTTDEQWRHVIAVNLEGTFRVTRALLPGLGAGARIINIASRAGREGTPMLAAYCAAKHGVVGFTRSLAAELRAAKVSVNAVCPGSVDTAMLREGLPDASPDMSPEDVARAVVFLATDAPEQLTGSCIDVFG